MADIGQDDGPVREALQHIGGQIIRGHKTCALDHLQLRMLAGKFAYGFQMLFQASIKVQVHGKQRLGGSGCDMAVAFPETWQDDAALLPQHFRARADILLYAGFIADIDKLAAGNGYGLGLGLVLVHGVDVAKDDFVCFHGQFVLTF